MKRKLILVSGADRVGKSSLITTLQGFIGFYDCSVFHHGRPNICHKNVFDVYRENVESWLKRPNAEYCVFDRSWVCAYILEEYRRRSHGHLDDIVDLELEFLDDNRFEILHVSIERPWNWSAKHHLVELREKFPEASPWFIRDEYVARMKEHKVYYKKLYDFYSDFTAFPYLIYRPSKSLSLREEAESLKAKIDYSFSTFG